MKFQGPNVQRELQMAKIEKHCFKGLKILVQKRIEAINLELNAKKNSEAIFQTRSCIDITANPKDVVQIINVSIRRVKMIQHKCAVLLIGDFTIKLFSI